MTDLNSFLSVFGGLLLRIAIPLGVTLFLGYFVHRLDERWMAESEATRRTLVERIKKRDVPVCWEYMNCPPSIQGICPIYGQKELLCWEYFGSDGAIRLGCKRCAYGQAYYQLNEAHA